MLPRIDDIIRKRKLLNLSQRELEKLSGVSQSTIAKIENKEINPSYESVGKIYEALKNKEKQSKIKAKDIMNKRMLFVAKDDRIEKAVRLMQENAFSQLPVVDSYENPRLVGSVSDQTTRRLIDEMLHGGFDLSNLSVKGTVKEIMDEAFPTISEGTSLHIVSSLLKENFAVIVMKRGNISGIITRYDLNKVLLKKA